MRVERDRTGNFDHQTRGRGHGRERDGMGTGRELRLMNRLCSPRPVPVPLTILLKIEMGRDGKWDGTGNGTDERSAGQSITIIGENRLF